ncbi:MAG: hypothetical protein GXZ04_03705 [Clostridiales bacterium]|nr:hypothetical protein [Clostridiales bacterium]
MPDFSYGLIAVLVLVSAIVRRVIRQLQADGQIRRSIQQRQAQTASPAPAGFQEAAPYQHPLLRKQEPKKPERRAQIEQSEEGHKHMANLPAFNEKMEKRRQEADQHAANSTRKQQPHSAPKPSVMPKLSGASLVQAVITKEILTRPPSARKPYYQVRRGT